jgi:manganese/zinc/iron transport system substrate-binding protein
MNVSRDRIFRQIIGKIGVTASVVFILALIGLFLGCGSNEKGRDDLSQRKINIVATIGMITDIVENVGGDRVNAHGLMGPGVDPHLYKASAGDVSLMSDADLIFYNGLHLEGAMAGLFEKMQRRVKTVAVTAKIDTSILLSPPEFAGVHDPHIWFDVSLWMMALEQVRDVLIEIDSGSAEYYRANAAAHLIQMKETHEYVKAQIQTVPEQQRVLITAHDAFNYYGRAYGIMVRGLQGISTSVEAGTGDIQGLADFIVERKIPAVFVESSVPRRNIEAVQAAVKSRGFEVAIGGELFSDAMGNPGTPEGTYLGMVRYNTDTIVKALLGQE